MAWARGEHDKTTVFLGKVGFDVLDFFTLQVCPCRYPFFFGAIQMVEADPTQADRVVTALYKFVSLANSMLHNGTGLEDWARTRWEDFVMTLEWFG